MAYTAPTVRQLRQGAGTLLQKVATELGLIEAAIGGAIGEETITTVPVSFETAGIMTTKVYFPYKVTVNQVRSIVTKALAGTNTGTITCGNADGASTGGVITVAISAALADEDSCTPTTNNVVPADSYYYLTTAKATAGGEALVFIEATRTL